MNSVPAFAVYIIRYWKGQAKEILGVPTYLKSYTLLFLQAKEILGVPTYLKSYTLLFLQAKEILGVPTYLKSYTLLFLQLMKPLKKGSKRLPKQYYILLN